MVGAPHSGTPHDAANGVSRPMFVLQDRYEVVNHLGQGGMGTVYVARDRRLARRQCVVKKLRDDFFRLEDREKAMSFFEREVDVLSKLGHPNIVEIQDTFKENDDLYLVMEYVEGENLHQMLHRRGEPFPEEQVLQWVLQVIEVLEYLHTNDPQIIYRDLKPSNIMIDTKDRVKLVDFGIARPYVEEADNTHVVSAGYSPPEQYWGAADPRSDIYALGATMYFLLTGEEPLALQTSSPRDLNPEVSLHTDMIVKRATAQDLLLRYQSAQEMKHDLEEWKKEKKEKNPVLKAVAITLGIVTALGIFGAGATFVGNLIEDKNRAEQESKQIELREQELKKKAAALQEIAQRQQGKLTDDISTHAAPSRPQDPQQPKQATVAFREVDEQELTDPDDAVGQRDPLTPPPIAPQSEPTADVIPKPAPKRRMKPPAAAPAPVNLPPIPMAAPYAKSTSTADEFDSPENQ